MEFICKLKITEIIDAILKKINEKVSTIYCGSKKFLYNLLYFFLYILIVKC